MKKLFALVTAGCLYAGTALAADVEINAAFARATAPGQPNSAVFMQLRNRGDASALIAADSPAAKVVELHTHIQDQGVMRMRRIERIELPAHEDVSLAPGGLHIMLIGLEQPLQAGSQIELTLEFADGSRQALAVPVKQVMPAGMGHGQGMQHGKPQS